MYEFRTLKSIYNIRIRYRKSDYTQYEYGSNIVVRAKKNKNDYLFTLEQRTDTKLDNQPPKKVMDKLMLELGNIIYPVALNVSKDASILSVSNFDEIKQRWKNKSQELYKANKTQAFQNYLKMSAKNFTNETKFRQSLYRDTFIQMFFLDYGNQVLEFDFVNFPIQSRKTSLYAIRIPNSSYHYSLHPAFKENNVKGLEGILNFRLTETGELWGMSANLSLENNEEESYVKNVLIWANKDAHETKTGFFF